jgi:hypothetical protein
VRIFPRLSRRLGIKSEVVLDANVFVSGVFFSGSPFQILKAWSDGRIQLVVSPEIIYEFRRVGEILAADHPAIDFTPVLDYVLQNGEILLCSHLSNLCAKILMMTNSLPAR